MTCICRYAANRIFESSADSEYFVMDLVQMQFGVIAEHLLETFQPLRQFSGGNPGIAMTLELH